ncbi:Uncharacterized protein FWK35_00014965 [Aphis craccivora]|uniref:Uncharacterized protein n=1 Tax=Aphis craccivora TaxID=307492 RepID=A0A6G0YDS6_APHCR|nr:Uncharacterized protein FWK35_00014965 [Aphis craccivora]
MTENKNTTEKNVNHNHQIDLQKLQRPFVSASAKRKATDDICERPAKILHRILTIQDTTLIKVWWRRIQKVDLSSEYKLNGSIIREWLLHVIRMVFLEPENVFDYFN